MKIVASGAAGTVGSAVARESAGHGHEAMGTARRGRVRPASAHR